MTAALAWVAIAPAGAAPRAPAALTARDTLVEIYDDILDARFAEAERDLRACQGAPPVACLVLDATRIWWQMQLDPQSRARDAAFSARVDEAIAAAEAWAAREPASAEAWFYVGAAYGARVQWRVLRVERMAAARDGKRIKEALETALRLDPALEDANFGIGLYQYYADVAPAVAKFLRWLLLLPGGNRAEGLERMLRARDRGTLIGGEADYQIHVIYLWYERRFAQALEIIEGLALRYPGNPLFPLTAADIHDIYFHDPTSAARTHERVLALARHGRLQEAALAETQARLGLARHLDTLFESDRALEHARAVIASRPGAPYGALAEAWLFAGRALARLGQVEEGRAALGQALASTPPGDALKVRERVHAAQQLRVDPRAAEAYRLGLAGWRAYGRKALADADAMLARAIEMRPADMVARYRHGVVLDARGNGAGARREWEIVAGAGASVPPPVFADACVALARVVEADGDRARAIALHRRASQTFGAWAETRATAARELVRLR